MSDILKLSISLSEYKTSGFTLKDTTSIANTLSRAATEFKFMSSNSVMTTTTLRTNDIVFLDFITLNRLLEPKVTFFSYISNSDDDYLRYKLDYESKSDGWFILDHVAVPKLNWVMNYISQAPTTRAATPSIMYAAEIIGDDIQYYRVTKIDNSEVTTEKINELEIYQNLSNSSVVGVEEEFFVIGNLEKCYEDSMKHIFYNKLFSQCKRDTFSDQVFRDRNMLFIALELVKVLMRDCNPSEAERIIEQVSACGGFCRELKSSYNNSRACNCS